MKGHALFQGEIIAKIHWQYLKKSSPPELLAQFQQNLAHSILWWRKFKFAPMKGHALYQGETITKWWKYIDKILKFFFSRTTVQISTKLGTKCPWVKRTQGFYKYRAFKPREGGNGFFPAPNQGYDTTIALLKCVYWFGCYWIYIAIFGQLKDAVKWFTCTVTVFTPPLFFILNAGPVGRSIDQAMSAQYFLTPLPESYQIRYIRCP